MLEQTQHDIQRRHRSILQEINRRPTTSTKQFNDGNNKLAVYIISTNKVTDNERISH